MTTISVASNNNDILDNSSRMKLQNILCELKPLEIPRPKCKGFQFISTYGRHGFYQSIKRSNTDKFGIVLESQAPRRPTLLDLDEWNEKLLENNNQSCFVNSEIPEEIDIPEPDYSINNCNSSCNNNNNAAKASYHNINPPPAPPLPKNFLLSKISCDIKKKLTLDNNNNNAKKMPHHDINSQQFR